MQARFENGIYRDCKWCEGKGCLACRAEADKEYARQFPDGPKPLLSLTHEEIDRMEISEMTGGASMESTHGKLGSLLAKIRELTPKEGGQLL